MHTIAGRIVKYVLWVLLVFILTLLCVGLIKYRGDVRAYVNFLNTRDWNQARSQLDIAQPSSFANMFRGTGIVNTTGIDLLSGELLTGELLTGSEFTGLDAYDPSMEEELNTMNEGSSNESGFGFTNADTTTTPTPDDSKTQLLNLIKQRELRK